MANHPIIVGFRWSSGESWGSTWLFLLFSIVFYLASSLFLRLLLHLTRRRRPLPLGPLPALHSLSMIAISFTIFLGTVFSAAAEIHETQWFWLNRPSSRLTHPLQWLLCFPSGTRSSGRVFFWSYLFYLSRFLHLLRTFFLIAGGNCNSISGEIFAHCAFIFSSFLWLEFSQSVQVAGILFATLSSAAFYNFQLWVGLGLPAGYLAGPTEVFRRVLMVGNVACQITVPVLHLCKGGCNGIGAWVFNSAINLGLLSIFFLVGETRRSWSWSWSGSSGDGEVPARKKRREK